jgi:hypothetical protein
MDALDMSTREKIIRARTQFTAILNDNMRTLNATKNSAKRLVERILDAAQKSVIDDRQTHYSAKGKTASWKTATMALSLDQNM